MTRQTFDNNLRGVLFKNDRKERDNHPDYKGNCEIEGEEFWISAWIKEGKSGKFMSLSFQPKEEKAATRAPVKQSREQQRDDDIPF